MDKFSRRGKRGFTLIELLVVIAIIAILAAILFPVFVNAKRKGYMVTCGTNLKEIGQAVVMYVGDHDGYVMRICDVFADGSSDWSHTTGSAYRSKNGAYYDLKPYIKNTKIWTCPSATYPNDYIDYTSRRRNEIDYRFNFKINRMPPDDAPPYYTKRMDACVVTRKFYLVSDRHSDHHYENSPSDTSNWIMLMVMADGHLATNVKPYADLWSHSKFGNKRYNHWDFPFCHPGQDTDPVIAAEVYSDKIKP